MIEGMDEKKGNKKMKLCMRNSIRKKVEAEEKEKKNSMV
jgi:hypothetical protein